MSQIASLDELISRFRPIDQDFIETPPRRFPFEIEGYYAWAEPSGARSFLLLERPGKTPIGICFRVLTTSNAPPQMCQWCHSVRTGDAVAMLSVSVNEQRRFGLYLCRDLSCRDKIRDTPSVGDLRDSKWTEDCDQRLLARMTDFVERNLA